eukprot:8664067-Pyramimonas_sp.AAC.1
MSTKTWTGKIGADMDEGERMFNDVEYRVPSDSTMASVSSKGRPALNSALKEQINARSSGSLITIRNDGSLDDIRASLPSMSLEEPLGHSSTRCRVVVWDGNEPCDYHGDICRRMKGRRREDKPSDYDEPEQDALSMIDDVVDEQAYVAHATGDMLVMLALGDGQ